MSRATGLIVIVAAACGSPQTATGTGTATGTETGTETGTGTETETETGTGTEAETGTETETETEAGTETETETEADEPSIAATTAAMAAGTPVRIVTVTTQTWGCCGVAPFITAAFPVGGPDDAYVLTVPRAGVADPELARHPGQHIILWGKLRPQRATIRAWLGERKRPLPTAPDAVANLDQAHPVLDVDAWCIVEAIGPDRCTDAASITDAPVSAAAAPASPTLRGAVHPIVDHERGTWTTSGELTADGERVHLTGPKEGGVTLGVSLERWSFDDDRDAIRKLAELEAGADPDTGLSYGWDTVERRGSQLVRLHGGCRWGAPRWNAIVARMHAWLGPADERLICTCGFGCRR